VIYSLLGFSYFITMPRPTQRKKNLAAVALSKLGASKGGLARAKSLSAKERSRIARLAVQARWRKHREEK
jgi:ABC-type phosphate/phosphonate transport system ATPase subunit